MSARMLMYNRPAPPLLPLSPTAKTYLETLRQHGFQGDIGDDYANRITFSTDNSIYQIFPEAVIFPRDGKDIATAMRLANQPEFEAICFHPRGGGTSCNGQSLGDGIVLDTSRHMRRILDFDLEARRVRLEPGVIRDQLNTFLHPHGMFFPPHVSTTNRATIGGMVSNDSSGKGSRVYGKTSAWIEALSLILPDGREVTVSTTSAPEVLEQGISAILAPLRNEIREIFPTLSRGFTGYDLLNAMDEQGRVSLPAVLCGSEGTLALITEITCRVASLPPCSAVMAVGFSTLEAGLRAVPRLLEADPSAIEFLDDKILSLVRGSDFDALAARLWGDGTAPPNALHFVEFEAASMDELRKQMNLLHALLDNMDAAQGLVSRTEAIDAAEVAAIWNLRKACQGLLLSQQGQRRAQPFIEDFVVPPEALADFIKDLRGDLASEGVDVGMFGHADVGVIHMRPLLDMRDSMDRARIRSISDAVNRLTIRYGGLFWGEHGKGFRGEYAEDILGPRLNKAMAEIKQLFDPLNRLNPGKIASPAGKPGILKLDAPPMRGSYDEKIDPATLDGFTRALHCNGNGNCFGLAVAEPLCPSYRATGDRRFSPKGRAGLLREWLRLRAAQDDKALAAMVPGLKESLDNCLSCKACAGGGCPVRVDIPEMRASFLEWYHQRHRRPLLHHLLRRLEPSLPWLAHLAPVANPVMHNPVTAWFLQRTLGLKDLPRLDGMAFARGLRKLGIRTMTSAQILTQSHRPEVVVVQDPFVPYFDARAGLTQVALLQQLASDVAVMTWRPSGKVLHVTGQLHAFRATAMRLAQDLAQLSGAGITLVGLDPPTTLMLRDEYRHAIGLSCAVMTMEEWIAQLPEGRIRTTTDTDPQTYRLAQHCTARALAPDSTATWVSVFRRFGLDLRVEATGCCGMAGLFGHEIANQKTSQTLYEQNWRRLVEDPAAGPLLATGFSCRCQSERLSGIYPEHPAEALLRWLTKGRSNPDIPHEL